MDIEILEIYMTHYRVNNINNVSEMPQELFGHA